MCGRYANIFDDWAEIWPFDSPFRGPTAPPPGGRNIPPKSTVAVLRADEAGPLAALMRWWLVPAWSPTPDITYTTFNARRENAAAKPAFRGPFLRSRCVIPASSFYEWRKNDDGTKTPHTIARADGTPLYFAGLWDRWQSSGTALDSCTILTAPPNAEMRRIHDRMPCILEPGRCAAWIDPAQTDRPAIEAMLEAIPDGFLELHPMSRPLTQTPGLFDSPE